MAKLTIESRIYDTSGLREKIQRILSEHNHMELAGDDIVRIPKIQGRIFERENSYGHVFIDLIYQRWYDPEARQSRNRKTTIGEMLDIIRYALESWRNRSARKKLIANAFATDFSFDRAARSYAELYRSLL